MLKIKGPSINPWGTPLSSSVYSLLDFPRFMRCLRSRKSKALLRSILKHTTYSPLSNELLKCSIILRRVDRQLYLFLKADSRAEKILSKNIQRCWPMTHLPPPPPPSKKKKKFHDFCEKKVNVSLMFRDGFEHISLCSMMQSKYDDFSLSCDSLLLGMVDKPRRPFLCGM